MRTFLHQLFAKLYNANITQSAYLRIFIGYLCMAELTYRLPSSATKPSNYNSLRILLLCCHHIDVACPKVIYVRPTVNILHQHTLLLVGSHAVPPPFATVFPRSYTLLTVLLVLGLNSSLTCSQDICSWSAVCTSDTLTGLLHVINLLLT